MDSIYYILIFIIFFSLFAAFGFSMNKRAKEKQQTRDDIAGMRKELEELRKLREKELKNK